MGMLGEIAREGFAEALMSELEAKAKQHSDNPEVMSILKDIAKWTLEQVQPSQQLKHRVWNFGNPRADPNNHCPEPECQH